jgi:hypothetical protein
MGGGRLRLGGNRCESDDDQELAERVCGVREALRHLVRRFGFWSVLRAAWKYRNSGPRIGRLA